MATASYTLNYDTWTAISTGAQKGTCWLQQGGMAAIDHSTTSSSTCATTKAFKLAGPNGGSNPMTLTPDGTGDIFYAIAIRTSDPQSVIITSDVI